MTDRAMVAYGLLVFLILAAAGVVWWNVRRSDYRTYLRQGRKREAQRAAAPPKASPDKRR